MDQLMICRINRFGGTWAAANLRWRKDSRGSARDSGPRAHTARTRSIQIDQRVHAVRAGTERLAQMLQVSRDSAGKRFEKRDSDCDEQVDLWQRCNGNMMPLDLQKQNANPQQSIRKQIGTT